MRQGNSVWTTLRKQKLQASSINRSIWLTWLGLSLLLWTWRKSLKNRKVNTHLSHIYLVHHHTPQNQSCIRRVTELLHGLGQCTSPLCYRNINLYYHQSVGPGSLSNIHPHHWGKPGCTCWWPGGALPWRSAGTDNRYHETESAPPLQGREWKSKEGKSSIVVF